MQARLTIIVVIRESVGKTINSPLLTHKIASSLSLMRIYVLYFSDVYLGSDTGLVISSSILFPNNFVGGSWLIGLIRRPFSLVFPVEMKRKGCLFRNGNVSNP